MLPKLAYRGGFRILHVRSQCPSLTMSTPPSDRMTIPPSGILESLARTVVWSALDISTHMNAVGLIETCHFSTALAGASRAVHWALWALTRPHTSNLMTKLTVAPPWSLFNCLSPFTPDTPRTQSLPGPSSPFGSPPITSIHTFHFDSNLFSGGNSFFLTPHISGAGSGRCPFPSLCLQKDHGPIPVLKNLIYLRMMPSNHATCISSCCFHSWLSRAFPLIL